MSNLYEIVRVGEFEHLSRKYSHYAIELVRWRHSHYTTATAINCCFIYSSLEYTYIYMHTYIYAHLKDCELECVILIMSSIWIQNSLGEAFPDSERRSEEYFITFEKYQIPDTKHRFLR